MRLVPPVLPPMLALSTLLAVPSLAAPPAPPPGQGALLTRTESGETVPVPLQHTEVEAAVTGNVAQVEVIQTFHNPYDRKIEALYVFPLPDRAAVSHMEIRLADRTIAGVVKTRDEARRIYQDALARGRVTALLDQERPNMFIQSVANILPGSEIVILIRYHETVPCEEGLYTFTFPMVVGPRFTPGPREAAGSGPPLLPPGRRSGHDIGLEVRLDAGATAREIRSPSHAIEVRSDGRGGDVIRLRAEDAIPDRDFVLTYRVDGAQPGLIVLPHRDGGDGYFLALIYPDAEPQASRIAPKEMIFVVDCSGSMFGPPIDKAKDAIRYALEHLNPLDTLQIIRFSGRAESFAPSPVLATAGNVERAQAYVDRLSAVGGTIMLEGVRAALSYPRDPDRLRIVSFMTDGYIGDEEEILAYVMGHLGEARMFPFGVGDAVNRYLLDRMAEFGRGAVEYLLIRQGTAGPVERFYERIRNPYLTDITLDWGGLPVTGVYPSRTPDLWLGQPVVLYGRYQRPGAGEITLRARLGGEPFERRFEVRLPERHTEGAAIAALWARARIEDLSREQIGDPQPAREQEIIAVALAHNLVTKHTSFVAVDEATDTGAEAPVAVDVPVPLPPGVGHQAVLGMTETVTTGSGQVKLSAEFIESLPIVGRNHQDVLEKAPERPRTVGGVVGGSLGGVVGGIIGGVAGARVVDVVSLTDGVSTPLPSLCRLESGRPTYRVGEPVDVILTVENRSQTTLRLPSPLSIAGGARFLILDDRGRALEHPDVETVPATGTSIPPLGKLSFKIRLDGPGGYPIVRPGRYRIVFVGSDMGLADSGILVVTIAE